MLAGVLGSARGSVRAVEELAGQPRPGQLVAGKYRLESELGRGGMSVVYGATHRVTGKRFAIKWLLPEVSVHPDATQRFVRESQVSGRVQHPNLVEIFDIGVEQGAQYIVMEWLEGESLEDKLTRAGRFSIEDACRYLLPCMQGVAAAHEAEIVHRDLKPANLFICSPRPNTPELAKVLDFGISMHAYASEVSARFTKTGTLMGTPHYMSPEQMRGRLVDHRTDIYAFGVILYQLVSGQLPFAADNFGELVVQVSTERARPLSEVVRGVPSGFEAIVARAMARDPLARHPDLESLIAELAPYARQWPPRRTSLRPTAAANEMFAAPISVPVSRRGAPGSIAPAVMDRPSLIPTRSPALRALMVGGALLALGGLAAGFALFGRREVAPVAVDLAAPPTPSSDAMSTKPAPPPVTAPEHAAPLPLPEAPLRTASPMQGAAGQPAFNSERSPINPARSKPEPQRPKPAQPRSKPAVHVASKPLAPPEPQPAPPRPRPEPHNPLQMQLQ
ncbi:MAG: protein kinase [Polyangiales bacterium]